MLEETPEAAKDFERYFQGLKDEERSWLLYTVDYVLNYKRGWRYSPNFAEFVNV